MLCNICRLGPAIAYEQDIISQKYAPCQLLHDFIVK